jgi:hypothetical protein
MVIWKGKKLSPEHIKKVKEGLRMYWDTHSKEEKKPRIYIPINGMIFFARIVSFTQPISPWH